MKKKIVFVLIFILVFGLFSAYSQTRIEKKYASQLEKTYVGMELEEFTQIWPTAKRGAVAPDLVTISYFIIHRSLLSGSQTLTFWFKDNKLTGYTAI